MFEIGKGIKIREGRDITLISTGSMVKDTLDVADILQKDNIYARVINMHTIKPIDCEIIIQAIGETGKIVTIEDHNIVGGLGSAVAEVIAESGSGVKFKRIGLHDFSQGYGSYMQVKEINGIGKKRIVKEIKELI